MAWLLPGFQQHRADLLTHEAIIDFQAKLTTIASGYARVELQEDCSSLALGG